MDDIHYGHSNITSSLGDVSSSIGAIQAIREDINSIFTVLATVYEGAGYRGMLAESKVISNMLDTAMIESRGTQTRGDDQNQRMAALDARHAGEFGYA